MEKQVTSSLCQWFRKTNSETDSRTLEFVSCSYTTFDNGLTLFFFLDDDNQIVLKPLTEGKKKYINKYINASYIDVSLS